MQSGRTNNETTSPTTPSKDEEPADRTEPLESIEELTDTEKKYLTQLHAQRDKPCCKKHCLTSVKNETALLFFRELEQISSEGQRYYQQFIYGLLIGAGDCFKQGSHLQYHIPRVSGDVCLSAFCAVVRISPQTLTNYRKNMVKRNSVLVPAHGLVKRDSNRRLPPEIYERMLTFLDGEADSFGDRRKQGDLQFIYLPSFMSKRSLYQQYCDAMGRENTVLSWGTFLTTWREKRPYVVIYHHEDNECLQCLTFRDQLRRSTEFNYRKVTENMEAHMEVMLRSRKKYLELKRTSQLPGPTGNEAPRPSTAHISLECGGTLRYPFKKVDGISVVSPKSVKVNMLIMVDESSNAQACYLSHEPREVDGSSIISCVHNFLEGHPKLRVVDELHLTFNLWSDQIIRELFTYLSLRLYSRSHQQIELHFLEKGHCAFSPDSVISAIHQQFKTKAVQTFSELRENVSQIIGANNVVDLTAVPFLSMEALHSHVLPQLSTDGKSDFKFKVWPDVQANGSNLKSSVSGFSLKTSTWCELGAISSSSMWPVLDRFVGDSSNLIAPPPLTTSRLEEIQSTLVSIPTEKVQEFWNGMMQNREIPDLCPGPTTVPETSDRPPVTLAAPEKEESASKRRRIN